MPKKTLNIPEESPQIVSEPAVAYRRDVAHNVSTQNQWNPNVPFHGTQEEWWEHFHRIEEGEFYPVFETHQRISKWLDTQKL